MGQPSSGNPSDPPEPRSELEIIAGCPKHLKVGKACMSYFKTFKGRKLQTFKGRIAVATLVHRRTGFQGTLLVVCRCGGQDAKTCISKKESD